jgi:uncharacterized protein
MKPVAVIDSSCVIALDLLNLMPKLAVLCETVLVPKAVRAELSRRRRTKDRLRALQREYLFVTSCDQYDQGAVDFLLVEKTRMGKKDRGETEAVVQAAETGAIVLIDDRRGRKIAERYALACHGTLWILEQLQLMELLPQTLRDCLADIKSCGIRLPHKETNELLRRLGQDPL